MRCGGQLCVRSRLAVIGLSRVDSEGQCHGSVLAAAAPSVAIIDFTRKEPQN